MGVDHRGFDVVVAEQFLQRSDVVAILEQMRGETMSERVAGHFLLDVGSFGCGLHASLDLGRIDMMSADAVRNGIGAESFRWEHILPFERSVRLLIFQMQGIRKGDVAISLGDILIVEKFHSPAVIGQIGDE